MPRRCVGAPGGEIPVACLGDIPEAAVGITAFGDAKAPPSVSGFGGLMSEDQMSAFTGCAGVVA